MTVTRTELLAAAADLVGGQRPLAALLGVNERNVRYWLSGTREPSPGVMADTAAILHKHAVACLELKDSIDKL